MKTLLCIAGLACAVLCHAARAEQGVFEHQLGFNAAVTSDYRYRGISQTRLQPAVQGGVDYVHTSTGLYAGAWLSSIKWTSDNGGNGHIEADITAGKRGALGETLSYDVGVLGYLYPGNGLGRLDGLANANTAELYGQLAHGPAYIKYSHALTNLFGFVDSRHSGYLDMGANIEVGQGVVINLHAGHQRVRNLSAASYTDWKLGLTRDFGFATLALAYIGTNAHRSAYTSPAQGKFLGRDTLLLTLSKTF